MGKRIAFWRDAIEYGEPLVHVAREAGRIVGFVGYDRSRDPKSKPTTGEIWALYVEPEHWGRGAGLALWDAAREGLIEEGCTEVTLWIPLCNDRALRFAELDYFLSCEDLLYWSVNYAQLREQVPLSTAKRKRTRRHK